MAFFKPVYLILALSLIIAQAIAQGTETLDKLYSEYCPETSGYSTLTACDNYSWTVSQTCQPEAVPSQFFDCFCDQGLYDLASSCISESVSCYGASLASLLATDLVLRSSTCSIYSSEAAVLGITSDNLTPSLTTGPTATSTTATTESSGSISSSSTITSAPETSTSATQAQASSTLTSVSIMSTRSSAVRTRSMSNVWCLCVGLVFAVALI